ncbi:hypothetical protein [Rummeliibacillus pycnus]|uniref:hypothetical protein n=1 Tax=Rummeliibacillus pycnus TaxID=101070 RepID=UPI0037CA7912
MSISILYTLNLLLFGCSTEDKTSWTVSPTFKYDHKTMYGTEGTFGIVKANGEKNEPEFPTKQGRLYDIYFLDSSKGVHENDGKKYKMTATHQDSTETVTLYEWDIWSNKSGAKFGFDKEGLWKIDVTIDDKPITNFIIKAEELK